MSFVQELRKYKIGNNLVLFDFISTTFVAFFVSIYTKIPFVLLIVILFVMGEIFHYIFRVPSNTMKYLGIY
jgi:hypothetical protein